MRRPAPSAASSCAVARRARRNRPAAGSGPPPSRSRSRSSIPSSPRSAFGPETRPTARRAGATDTAALQTATRFWAGSSRRRLFLRELKSHFTVAVGVVAPVFAHLHEQEQMHGDADDLRDLLARIRADRLDGGAALAEHDLALAFALDKNRLLDADRLVLAFGPAVGFDGGLIRQFLMQLAEDFFPRDFRRQMPHRRVRHLVFGIMKRPRRHHLRQRVPEVVDAIA